MLQFQQVRQALVSCCTPGLPTALFNTVHASCLNLCRVSQEDALEGVNYVRQSAHQVAVPATPRCVHRKECLLLHYEVQLACAFQAFLETEPGTRATTEEYMMRYQKFAVDDLNRALKKHQDLLEQIGMHAERKAVAWQRKQPNY